MTTWRICIYQGVLICSWAVSVAAAPDTHAGQGADVPQIVVTAAAGTASPLQVVMDPRQPRQPVPAHDGADYLKTVPGFSVIRKGGTDGDALFRGMAASRVNIMADDSPLFGGCANRMDPPTAYVFPQSYDEVRVLKGPQSVLWGAGASAATVLFERTGYDPDRSGRQLSAGLVAGSWGRRDLVVDGTLGNRAGYLRLNGSDSWADDYKDGDGNDVHSRHRRWHLNLAAGWIPVADTLVEVSAARSDGEAAYADRGMDGSGFARATYGLKLQREYVSTLLTAVEARLSYNTIDHVMDNFSLRSPVPGSMSVPRASNPDRRTISGRLQADLNPGAAFELAVGADIRDDRHRVRATNNQTLVRWQDLPRDADAAFFQTGLFAELSYSPRSDTTWITGLRHDRVRAEDKRTSVSSGMMREANATAGAIDRDTLVSGFARIEQRVGPGLFSSAGNTTLFAGVGHTTRPADYWERIGGSKRSATANSAFHTKPERTGQLDLGMISLGDGHRSAVSLFYSEVADFILVDTRMPGATSGSVVARNVDARSFGGELELSGRVGAHWLAQGTLAYVRGYNRTDDLPLAQMPPLETRMSLTYATERYTLGGLLRLVSSQRRVDVGRGNVVGQDRSESAGFGVFSLNGSYRPIPAVSVAVGVDNLFDRRYAEHLSRTGTAVAGFSQTGALPEPGRMLWLNVDVRL
jgi:iron complex outermembrane recepter protein